MVERAVTGKLESFVPDVKRIIGIYGVPNLEIFHRPVQGVIRYCDEHSGFYIRDFRLTNLLDISEGAPPPWRGQADGVVLGFNAFDHSAQEAADWIATGGVPAVSVAADWFDPRVPTVYVDRASLAELAANHLIECGCNSFLYFGFQHSAGSRGRAAAFRKALAKRRHELAVFESRHAYLGSFEDESALTADQELHDWLHSLPAPIGVWALNDNYARAICLACERANLAIPGQVKVLGVDDLSVARMYHPTISSIRTPGEEIGYLAMRELHKLLDGRAGVCDKVVVQAPEVTSRESTRGAEEGDQDLHAVLKYIERHACEGVPVDRLVALIGGSRRSLEQRFRAQLGRSPGEEIRRVRLERAKKLLTQTDLSMSRIASMVGYEESAAFSKFFRKATGQSPREFRAQGSEGTEGDTRTP